MPVDRATVVRVLREIALLLQLKGENAFKCRAYEAAADRIAGQSEDLAQHATEQELLELPGIGESIAEKIATLVRTGKLPYYEELKAEFPPGILTLLEVQDVGPKKAATLWRSLGVGDVASLEAACREGRVERLKGFGKKSQEKILAGVELYRRAHEGGRKLLGDVRPAAEKLLARISSAPGVVRASIAGSVRRMRETVADLDLIASADDPAPVFASLIDAPGVAAVLGKGETKCSVRLAEADLQVDLRVLPDADFATALHHFTGSKAHHIRLRSMALERGLKISEWGVFRGQKKLPVHEEKDLYALLDLPWIPPELREDSGEIEAAQAGRLPKRLLEPADVQGVVHLHTTASDGKHSLEQMVKAAQKLGYHYLVVTEHSQSSVVAGGLKADALQRQCDEIDKLNRTLEGFVVLKGVESDILEDGSLDYPDRVLERLDVIIGSVHTRHGQDRAAMTRRIVRAFEHPRLQIWGHPTGRLIGSREAAPLDLDEIFDAAAKRGVAVEVNGNPERLDLSAEHVRSAVGLGVRLVVGTDAHSTEDLTNTAYAVGTARRGWAEKDRVLNTLPAQRFLAALRQPQRP